MEIEKSRNLEIYKSASEMVRIGNKAVREAQNRLRAKGLPIVFSRNGRIFYELPDGQITEQKPSILND